MPNTQGKVSPLLAAILRDKEASERLRLAIAKGEDFVFTIEGITYRISTSGESSDLPNGKPPDKISYPTGSLQPT
jgi:hypothetical protein